MSFSLTTLCLSLAAVGALLILHGRRGRQRQGDRWCRACRGILSAEELAAVTCGRCQANLTASTAVGTGRRTQRPIVIVVGAIFIWASSSVMIARGVDLFNAIEWDHHKPLFMLINQAESQDGTASLAAIEELLRRKNGGLLSSAGHDALVDLLLTRVIPAGLQTSIPWAPIVEEVWIAGKLDRSQQLELARRLASLHGLLSGRDGVRQGTFVSYALNPGSSERLARHIIIIDAEPLEVTLDGEPIPTEFEESAWPIRIAPGSQQGGGTRVQFPVTCEVGDHTLASEWNIRFRLDGQPQTALTWTEVQSQSITVLPADEHSREILIDQRSSDAVRKATRVDLAGVRRLHPETGEDVIIGVIDPLAADVNAQLDYEVWLGDELVQATQHDRVLLICIPVGRRQPDARIRIILRSRTVRVPTFDIPGREPDRRAIWYGPGIVFEPGPIEWFDSIQDERIAETLRTRRWDMVIRRLQPPSVVERRGSHWADSESQDK